MTASTKPDAATIRQARIDNPKLRERDLSLNLGISEAEFVAAHVGFGVTRIEANVGDFLAGIGSLGEVMALTRNESAVHEKIGPYEKVVPGKHAALVLGEQIDLRIFPGAWKFGFAVEKKDGEELKRSLQFFDKSGEAVHKVHLKPASNVAAYLELVEKLKTDDQADTIAVEAYGVDDATAIEAEAELDVTDLRDRWSRMTDTHQFMSLLKATNLTRQQAVRAVGQDYAWPLDNDSVTAMLNLSAQEEIPIMCFIGNRGCIQIHSGPIRSIKSMGPWINILDETFHMHLRTDHIVQVWAVRKPSKDGHITSVEAYDAKGELIIQFFGKRHEGHAERDDWRALVENLPRISQSSAA